jgi:hypothetical protein
MPYRAHRHFSSRLARSVAGLGRCNRQDLTTAFPPIASIAKAVGVLSYMPMVTASTYFHSEWDMPYKSIMANV